MKIKTIISKLKIIIIVLAVLNLIALFVFEYKLPSFLSVPNKTPPATATPVVTENSDYKIVFDNDTITYDGTGEFDLLTGVSVSSPDGSIQNDQLFVHIKTGDTLTEKEIIYSVDTPAGQISETRKLILKNYTGPSIILPETLPKLEESNLDTLLASLMADDSFHANDGFGKELSSQVTVDYTIDPGNPSVVHYTLSLTNIFNDAVSLPVDINISSNRPSLVLSTNAVTISKNTSFQPMEYVEEALDINGNSCYNRIRIDGSVDITTPGVYNITYTCTDTNGNTSHPQQLKVTVE